MRPSLRSADALRPVRFTRHFTRHAEGSVLVCFGDTQVICTASVEENVPGFLKGQGPGLGDGRIRHAAALHRQPHEARSRQRLKQSGRAREIQRLIGRSLRAVVDPEKKLGERQFVIDCDDPGRRRHLHRQHLRRLLALHDAIAGLLARGALSESPLLDHVAAVSVGVYQGWPVLDLDYPEDSACDTDITNVVMTGAGGGSEIQGTAEGHSGVKKAQSSWRWRKRAAFDWWRCKRQPGDRHRP